MTAADVDALDKLREALAEAMASSARGNTYAQWAATILPVVVQFANERAAAALEAAAEDYLANTAFLDPMREMRRGDVATDLMWRASTTRARAAALRASNEGQP